MHGETNATIAPSRWLMGPVLMFLAAVYLLPGAFIVLLSMGMAPPFRLDFSALSLDNFQRFFASPYYIKVLVQTIVVGLVVGVTTAVMGYPVAYYLVRSRSRWKRLVFFLTLIPMTVGMNLITLGWMVVLGRHGLLNSFLLWTGIIEFPLSLMYTWITIVIGLTHVLFTFMVFSIAGVLKNIDPSVERAARNLGAGPVRAFLHITLPLSLEGVAAGFLMVFMLASGALVLPLLLGGQGNMVLPVLIWEQFFVANDRSFAATLALMLLAMAMLVLWIQLKTGRWRQAIQGNPQ